MNDDEHQIRELVQKWIEATKQGDTATVLSFMADDVIFLLPGRSPMTKAEFAAASIAQSKSIGLKIEGISQIQEINIAGDWAYLWTKLKVIVHPPGGTEPMIRAGHTLSVLKKQDGKWVLFRDANLLAPV